MKYAALIFGDDDRPKKAAGKLQSSPEPGQIVRSIDGSVYRVASKIAGPDGFVVKLANLQGKPVQTPQNFRPVGLAMARLASWLRYHLAYNKDFSLYINSYIERHNAEVEKRNKDIDAYNAKNPDRKKHVKRELVLPYPVGQDGKPFRWSEWFEGVVSPQLSVPGNLNTKDKQAIKDEMIHEMLMNVLGERNILDQFAAKTKTFGGGVTKKNLATMLTVFLARSFKMRVIEMQKKINHRLPEEEISMWQPSDEEGEGEVNILETEEHGTGEEEFQSAEARRDIAKFREAFRKWLIKPNVVGEKAGENFILMFDIFWRQLQESESGELRRRDLEKEWTDKTGLSFGSFKDYFMRLPDMIENFIVSHSAELGDKSVFIDLMNTIREEREKRQRKEQAPHKERKEKAVPAMAASSRTAGVTEDFAEAISNSANPDVVDPDIKQPTESAGEAAKQAGGVKRQFEEEMERREKAGECQNCGKKAPLNAEGLCAECAKSKSAGGVKRMYEEDMEANERLLSAIRPGDRVTIWVPAGMGREGQEWKESTGKAVMKGPHGWVLNMGGAHGTPGVATPENIIRVKQASVSKTAQNLIRGDQLTPDELRQVKNFFIYRWTTDNKKRGEVYPCDKCDVRNNPYVNEVSAEGHQHPTIPLQSDEEWLNDHAFWFTNAGKLLPNRHAQPAYLAPEPEQNVLASVAHKFAMEKAAYNPGIPEYIYRGDVYCEICADAIKAKLDAEGRTPANPKDEGSYDSDDYPKGPYFNQESDAPEHCARCGLFLENPLTREGYRYLNQMIAEADDTGAGNEEVIKEWKEFYPERTQYESEAERIQDLNSKESALDDDENACDTCGSDLEGGVCPACGRSVQKGRQFDEDVEREFQSGIVPKRKMIAMIPHEFNDADGQAIRNETYPDTGYTMGEADTAELKQPRVAAEHEWECLDCGHIGKLDPKGGGCEACGSQAVFPVQEPGTEGEIVRETKPVDVEKRMIPIREQKVTNPPRVEAPKKPVPEWRALPKHYMPQRARASKTADNTSNLPPSVTPSNAPKREQPVVVPEAIDQTAGPHSPNAPSTAPRTPGIVPKVVNVPHAQKGEEVKTSAWGDEEEHIVCPECGSHHIDIEPIGNEGLEVYCEDCEKTSFIPNEPATRSRNWVPGEHADELEALERLREEEEAEREPPEPEPDFEEHEAAVDEERLDHLLALPQEEKESWLVQHGWKKDDSWHGASWWMQKPMWTKEGYEESIPYQDTDEAIEKEVEIQDEEQIGKCLGCGDPLNNAEGEYCGACLAQRGEDKYGSLKEAAISVSRGEDSQGFHILVNMNGREYVLRGQDAENFRRQYAAIPKPEAQVNALVQEYMNKLQPYAQKAKPAVPPSAPRTVNAPSAPGKPDLTRWLREQEAKEPKPQRQKRPDIPAWLREQERKEKQTVSSKQAAGSNSGNDDDRGAGDLWREEFYEHRTIGPSSEAMLSGIKESAAAAAPAPVHPNVQQNISIARPPAAVPGATQPMVAITPGEGEEERGLEKRTVPPELPNANYHMMSSLISAEARKLAEADPEARANPDMFTEAERWDELLSEQERYEIGEIAGLDETTAWAAAGARWEKINPSIQAKLRNVNWLFYLGIE